MRPSENPNIKEIVKIIQSMPTHGSETVYRDWAECFALSIQNGCDLLKNSDLWKRREQRYLDIIKKYSKDEAQRFAEMCAHLTLAFERDPFQDYLGIIYMEIFGGQKKLGQCFTPMDLCKLCAQTAIGEEIPKELRTLGDECVGGGAMPIAACWWYHTHNVDYQKYLKIYCGDIDSLCVHMTYIQLSLIGARAEVWHRDAITRTVHSFGRFTTPMELLLWPMKYDVKKENEAESKEDDSKETVSIESLIDKGE